MTKSIYETDYFQFELIDGNSQKKEMADCKNKLNFFSPKSIWRPRPRAEGALAPSCWLQSTVGAGGQGRQPERLP